MQGTLAFLDPRTRALRPSESATPGARPLEWSRDHHRLLFQALDGDGRPQLQAVDVTTGDVHVLTRGPALHPHGSYGPDGRLAFAEAVPVPGRQDATSRIFVTEAGGAPRPLTEGPHDLRPVWSPDGSIIVFTSRGPDGDRIVRVTPEGGTPQLLARGQDPAFAPDGAWIVYSAKTRKGQRLWRMRPDGSGKLPVGAGVTEESDPVFSPDGRFVLFVVEEAYRQRLVVRRLDGRAERVLFDDGGGSSPAW
jgi:TolB protein